MNKTISSNQIDRNFLDKQVGDWQKLANQYKAHFTWNNQAALFTIGLSMGICLILGLITIIFVPSHIRLFIFLGSLAIGIITSLLIIAVLAANAIKKPMVIVGQIQKITVFRQNNIAIGYYLKFEILKAASLTINGFDQENDQMIGSKINIYTKSIEYFEKCPADQIQTLLITGTKQCLAVLEDGKIIA